MSATSRANGSRRARRKSKRTRASFVIIRTDFELVEWFNNGTQIVTLRTMYLGAGIAEMTSLGIINPGLYLDYVTQAMLQLVGMPEWHGPQFEQWWAASVSGDIDAGPWWVVDDPPVLVGFARRPLALTLARLYY